MVRPAPTPSSCTLRPYSVRTLLTNRQTDLKSTTDDALAPYLVNLPKPHGYTQDHTKTTVRFIVGFPAVALAGFTFYADRYLGWEATQSPWIIASVVVYFLLNSVFTVWVWLIEGGEVFSGRRSNGEVVCFPLHSPSLPK